MSTARPRVGTGEEHRLKLPRNLQALTVPKFRRATVGLGVAQVGLWVQLIATSWLVFSLSGSTIMLGVATFCLQIPLLVVTPFAGVLLDRLDGRKVLLASNMLSIAQSAVLLALVASGRIEVWHLVLANLVQGIATSVDTPARQALLPRLIDDRAQLAQAIALSSIVMNGARFAGPMLGGLVTALLGLGAAFAANMVLRAAALLTIALLALPPRAPVLPGGSFASQLASGLRFAFAFLPTRSALLLLAATSFWLQSYGSLMPWFAAERFHGDSGTLGILLSAGGLGAVSGMVYLASRQSVRGLYQVIGASALLSGIAMAAFSFAPWLWLALPALFLAAMGMMLTASATNTVLQTIVSDDPRGRMSAIYLMCFLGLAPVGSLFTGWLAERCGAPHALALGAAAAMLGAGLYRRALPAITRQVLPLYEKLGVPPNPLRRWW
jgi:MFS family permease